MEVKSPAHIEDFLELKKELVEKSPTNTVTDCFKVLFRKYKSLCRDILTLTTEGTVHPHNKHIFVRPKKVCLLWGKCLLGGKVLIWGSGGFRILGIVYTVKTLVLKLDFLFIFFERKFSDLKTISSISSGFFVCQI